MRDLVLSGATVLWPDGPCPGDVHLSGGQIVDGGAAPRVDLSGFTLLPGIVDIHGDGFERHLAPRRGAVVGMDAGLAALDAELGACGITTAVLAQSFSWEGGMRGPAFAEKLAEALVAVRDAAPQDGGPLTDLRMQLRLETGMMDAFDRAEALIDRFGVGYLVFNDHLPHKALAEARRPPGLIGQALKAGHSPEDHWAMLQDMHDRRDEAKAAVAALAQRLTAKGVLAGSHDDTTAADRAAMLAIGLRVAEFPETEEAAQAAVQSGCPVIMGAPNALRGGSHKKNVSARDMAHKGYVTALASDYHYPAPALAALRLAGEIGLASAWGLVSTGPAGILGLSDRGRIVAGLRADLVVLDQSTGRIGATICGGRPSFMAGAVAERFISAG